MLEEVKEEHEQLEKLYSSYLYKNEEITEEEKTKVEQNSGDGNNADAAILHQLSEQIFGITRQQQMMYQWGVRFMAAYNGDSTRDNIVVKFPKTMKK
jgi:hypothetical protein